MTTLTIRASFARPRENVVAQRSDYRISTQNLKTIDDVLKLAAGFAMYWVNPTQTINGAFSGAAIRYMGGEAPNRRDERTERASRTGSICFSAISATYAFATPGPHLYIPFMLGFSAAANGAFGLLRRCAGSSKNNV